MEMTAVDPSTIDTGNFGPGLRGKSVFMVVGTEDTVTPQKLMFDPVVARYKQTPGLIVHDYRIPGDHSFSWSRVQLTDLVLEWLDRDCR